MSLASRKLIQATAGAAGAEPASDDDFANVVLLLDGDGTSGDDNNTFTDSSTNGFTVTETGSVVQGSFSPYGDNWSNYFDGNQYLISDTAAPAIGTNDFTIEFWYNGGAQPNRFPSIVGTLDAFGATGAWRVFTYNNNANTFMFGLATTAYTFNTENYNDGVWRHFAVTREGTDLRGFVNGVQQGSTLTMGGNLTSRKILVAGNLRDNDHQEGFISNVRVINGTALYTSDFTPPTEPLTAVTNTDFLGCQSNRFLDNSTNNLALSTNGTPKVTPFSPFKDDDARTLTTDGGSAYFNDTTNEHLSISHQSGFLISGQQFTIEFWFYPVRSGVDDHVASYNNGNSDGNLNWLFRQINNNSLRFVAIQSNGTVRALDSTSKIIVNGWNHVVATGDGSSFIKMWLNGNYEGSISTDGTNQNNTSNANIQIAKWINYYAGYISDFRYVVGSQVYTGTSDITLPTSPLTAVTNTNLLLNFKDAGIYDRSGINNLDTVGNAQIDTAVKKYGSGSIEFDGSGDYLKGIASADELNMGTGDWTIEGWYYVRTRTTAYPLIIGNNDSGFNAGALAITTSNNDSAPSRHEKLTLADYDDTSARVLSASSAHNLNQWYHFAVVRNGTNITIYRDGTSVASKTISSALTYDWGLNGVLVGGGNWDGANSYSDAIFDDLRITKGLARYTANFTPPDAALPKF